MFLHSYQACVHIEILVTSGRGAHGPIPFQERVARPNQDASTTYLPSNTWSDPTAVDSLDSANLSLKKPEPCVSLRHPRNPWTYLCIPTKLDRYTAVFVHYDWLLILRSLSTCPVCPVRPVSSQMERTSPQNWFCSECPCSLIRAAQFYRFGRPKRGNLESCGGKTYARASDLSISTGQNQFFPAGQTIQMESDLRNYVTRDKMAFRAWQD